MFSHLHNHIEGNRRRLQLVKKMIESYDMKIEIKVNYGSKFKITLPSK